MLLVPTRLQPGHQAIDHLDADRVEVKVGKLGVRRRRRWLAFSRQVLGWLLAELGYVGHHTSFTIF